MLRRIDPEYQVGRTYDLQKYKPLEDAETVVDHKPKGIQSIKVKTLDGKEFSMAGFSPYEDMPPIGTTITYQFIGKTKNGIPRHATFLRIRGSF